MCRLLLLGPLLDLWLNLLLLLVHVNRSGGICHLTGCHTFCSSPAHGCCGIPCCCRLLLDWLLALLALHTVSTRRWLLSSNILLLLLLLLLLLVLARRFCCSWV
jgi:hypothetical protein